ncbi:hypothetical protein HY971_04495 [Candidatus Kaiserbacteria bacterium]|nr:hypothetical protein [Candidatus Kaiserbacteria bacterium]
MTLTSRRMSAGLATLFAILAAGTLLLGNQRLAHAEVPPNLGSQIVCRVFTDLNHIGPPIPLFPGDCQNPPGSPPQCSDGIDNDADGLADYPADTGCSSTSDNTEAPNPPPPPQCSNGSDDDNDSFTDQNDPNCHTDGDPTNSATYNPNGTEAGSLPACWNGVDDDGDGLKDFPADPGCTSALDTSESNTPTQGPENTLALCSDGIDNDADSKVDLADPDCAGFQAKLVVVKIVVNDNGGTSVASDFSLHIATSSTGSAEAIGVSSGATTTVHTGTWTVSEVQKSGYTATFGGDCNTSGQVTLGAGETKTCTITNNDIAPSAPACSDGIDNDNDGKIDSVDPGCSDANDTDEANAPESPACSDGLDNDDDDLIDSADPGCNDSNDTDETNTPPSSGGGGAGGGGGGGGGIGPDLISPGGAIFTAGPTAAVLGVATTTALLPALVLKPKESCDMYVTSFIKSGAKNDADQVRRLQHVLREYEGAKIEIHGVYDEPTLAAVHTFQSKYAQDVLTPWGITKSTGFTYLTTRKKINEVYCRGTKQFPLTTAEQQTIVKSRSPIQPLSPTSTKIAPAASPSPLPAEAVPETAKSLWQRLLDVVKGARGQ